MSLSLSDIFPVRDEPGKQVPDETFTDLRAACYLRVSTDHQRYSLENQRVVVDRYASRHGYEIVRSYDDEGRSGVTARGRDGLKALLADVLSGNAPFASILVMDVSRWGRFQDPDEAAHYEFLCREAGLSIHYCSEPFANDTMGSVLKQLKRVMAGEYSRDLSIKVRSGRLSKAERGRALGGLPIYGFRRRIINADGSDGPVLADGERKGRFDQEVRYVWGPPEEGQVLNRIFDLFVHNGVGQTEISRRLCADGVVWRDGTPWNGDRVQKILRRELMVGLQAYGKTNVVLGETEYVNDRSRWRYRRVLPPLIDIDTFVAAQVRLGALVRGQGATDDELIRGLKRLVERGVALSIREIDAAADTPCAAVYRDRFGSMREAYQTVGYSYHPHRRALNSDGTPFDRDQIIAALRTLRARNGRVSIRLIKADPAMPPPSHIRAIFGSMPAAYSAAALPWGRGAQVIPQGAHDEAKGKAIPV